MTIGAIDLALVIMDLAKADAELWVNEHGTAPDTWNDGAWALNCALHPEIPVQNETLRGIYHRRFRFECARFLSKASAKAELNTDEP